MDRRWKRRLTIGGLAVAAPLLALGAAFGGVMYVTFRDVVPPVDGLRVGPARVVVDGYVSALVVDVGDGVVLIDAGEDPAARAILAALAEEGRGPGDVRAILLTHGHRDHRGGVGAFPGAEVYAHAAELPWLRGERAYGGPIPRLSGHHAPLAVDHAVTDGEVVELGARRFRAFHVPGHTAGSVAWLVGGVLVLGDAAHAETGGALAPSPWVFSDDVAADRASLEGLPARLEAAGARVDWLVFSHSAPLRGMGSLEAWAARRRAER